MIEAEIVKLPKVQALVLVTSKKWEENGVKLKPIRHEKAHKTRNHRCI